jgi:hypothetical protein
MRWGKVWSDVLKRASEEFGSFAGLEMPLQNALSSKLPAAACARVVLKAKMNVNMVWNKTGEHMSNEDESEGLTLQVVISSKRLVAPNANKPRVFRPPCLACFYACLGCDLSDRSFSRRGR